MRGIHCFSTNPIFMGRDVSGHDKIFRELQPIVFSDYMLETLCLSALQWKKTNGPITLHTDTIFYNYLKDKGVTSFWDSIECSLDGISKKLPDVDQAVFWSASKFYCYQMEKTPFACVDTDIIVWRKLDIDYKYALFFTHWESIEEGDDSYVNISKINVSQNYTQFNCMTDIKKGLNMSITVLIDEEFKQKFTQEAFRFMLNSPKKYDKRYATPEILYMEQVLPVQIAVRYGYKIKPLIQCTWSPKQFTFVKHDKVLGDWIFNIFNQNHICTHLWFHKNYIEKNQQARKEYMDALSDVFKQNFPHEYSILNGVRSEPNYWIY